MSKAHFRECCFFALGIFCWAVSVQLMHPQLFSIISFIAAIGGIAAALINLKYVTRWYEANQ